MGKKYKQTLKAVERDAAKRRESEERLLSLKQRLENNQQPKRESAIARRSLIVKNPETGYLFEIPAPIRADEIFGARIQDFPKYRAGPAIPPFFERICSTVFFNGGHIADLLADRGYRLIADKEKKDIGLSVMGAFLSSYEPSHDHKLDAAAWVLYTISELIPQEELTDVQAAK